MLMSTRGVLHIFWQRLCRPGSMRRRIYATKCRRHMVHGMPNGISNAAGFDHEMINRNRDMIHSYSCSQEFISGLDMIIHISYCLAQFLFQTSNSLQFFSKRVKSCTGKGGIKWHCCSKNVRIDSQNEPWCIS